MTWLEDPSLLPQKVKVAVLVVSPGCSQQCRRSASGRTRRTGNDGDPEVSKTQLGIHHASKHLWEPVVNPCQHSKDRRHAHNDVEVRYDEVGVVNIDVQRRIRQNDPVKPPVTNVLTKPMLNSIAGVNRMLPCHNVVM